MKNWNERNLCDICIFLDGGCTKNNINRGYGDREFDGCGFKKKKNIEKKR